jgi:hypothetical protein
MRSILAKKQGARSAAQDGGGDGRTDDFEPLPDPEALQVSPSSRLRRVCARQRITRQATYRTLSAMGQVHFKTYGYVEGVPVLDLASATHTRWLKQFAELVRHHACDLSVCLRVPLSVALSPSLQLLSFCRSLGRFFSSPSHGLIPPAHTRWRRSWARTRRGEPGSPRDRSRPGRRAGWPSAIQTFR